MAEKKGAGGKRQEYDERTGRYGVGSTLAKSDEEKLAQLKRIYDTVDTSDEPIPRSLSAKASNYDVHMPDASIAHIVEGTYIRNKHVFAGYGTKVPFRNTTGLLTQYGGVAEDWAKVKGEATLEQYGKAFDTEIHWCENPKLGVREEFKFKRYL